MCLELSGRSGLAPAMTIEHEWTEGRWVQSDPMSGFRQRDAFVVGPACGAVTGVFVDVQTSSAAFAVLGGLAVAIVLIVWWTGRARA
jgi:hypothetical protein